jgi:hypothetical protein
MIEQLETTVDALVFTVPMGRVGQAEEIAHQATKFTQSF